MVTDRQLQSYCAERAAGAPWSLAGCCRSGFRGAVVIPALAESAGLQATLASIARNPPALIDRFLVVVVVNHRIDAADADKADNAETLRMLPTLSELLPFPLAWIDAASPGRELPVRSGGVGLARKIGFDHALSRLDCQNADPLLVGLDADTLVQPDYLEAIECHFLTAQAGGAVIPFRHQPAATPAAQDIIDCYELFLRSYVHGLACAASPYAFHTVGSAMACTVSAYLRSGGMNSRQAGEDFYFLQQLKKTSGIATVPGTEVHPSPRPSHRVPFGTGRSVSRALGGDREAITFYRPECFQILRSWLDLISGSIDSGAEMLIRSAAAISQDLAGYLDREGFAAVWPRISRAKKSPAALLAAFHEWFDGLRTMKLVHHLSAETYPRCSPEESVPHLLGISGLEPVHGIREQLELLRVVQNGR